MAKPEWGTKRTCHNCGARFYDLRREPVVCPACNSALEPGRQPKPRRGSPKAEPVAPARVKADDLAEDATENHSGEDEAAADDLEDIAEDEKPTKSGDMEEEEDLIEDTSDLGEDDDDIGEVIEHIDDDTEDKT